VAESERSAGEAGEADERARARRSRLAEIFGEVLPETTSDEPAAGSAGSGSERWYRENRPPHHDAD